MTRTVGGRPFNEVLSELRVKKEPKHSLDNGIKYFKADEYVDAFDSIIGPANYDVEYSDFSYTRTEVGEIQELYSVKCRITILDDEGNKILAKEAYGGYVSRYNKANHKDVNLQNAPDFVCSYAFKNAAKRFGTFGVISGEVKMPEKTSFAPKSNEAKANKEKKQAVLNFRTKGKVFVERETDSGNVYKLNAYAMDGDKPANDMSQIIFYPDKYRKDSDRVNGIISKCTDTTFIRLRIKTTYVGEDKNGVSQYVFLSFAA